MKRGVPPCLVPSCVLCSLCAPSQWHRLPGAAPAARFKLGTQRSAARPTGMPRALLPVPLAGIDIDSSTDIEVSGCRITTADDAVCLKTTSAGRPTEHVRVQDCTLQSRSSAVKLGSESRAAFRDISFTNLTVGGLAGLCQHGTLAPRGNALRSALLQFALRPQQPLQAPCCHSALALALLSLRACPLPLLRCAPSGAGLAPRVGRPAA